MLHLPCLFQVWAPCPAQIRDKLWQCILSKHQTLHKSTSYTFESAGSGIRIHPTTPLTSLLEEYRIFVGHGGPELESIQDLPKTFQSTLVLAKRKFQGKLVRCLGDQVGRLMWSPDGTMLVGCTQDLVTIYDSNGNEFNSFSVWSDKHELAGVMWHPTQPYLTCVVNVRKSGQVYAVFYSTNNWQRVFERHIGGNILCRVTWSPLGNVLECHYRKRETFTANGKSVFMKVDLPHITNRWSYLYEQQTYCVAWNSNGICAIAPSGGGVTLFDSVSGKTVVCERLCTHVLCDELAWNTDGNILAGFVEQTNQIFLWDESGRCLYTIYPTTDNVMESGQETYLHWKKCHNHDLLMVTFACSKAQLWKIEGVSTEHVTVTQLDDFCYKPFLRFNARSDIVEPTWLPGVEPLLFVQIGDAFQICDLGQTFCKMTEIAFNGEGVTWVSWNPQGTKLICMSDHYDVRLYE